MVKLKDFYKTLLEASQAVKKLDLKTHKAYSKLHHRDPKLPANPWSYYKDEWIDWFSFTGTKNPNVFYPTLEKASQAARRLLIRNSVDYLKRYKEDPLLPSEPKNTYKDSWRDWHHFLKLESRVELFRTYEEARSVVNSQNIKSFSEYQLYRKKEKRLPASPHRTYQKSWIDADHFFDRPPKMFYPSIKQASRAAIKLGITSSKTYKKLRSKDPHLPAEPSAFYKNTWQNWYLFLELGANKYTNFKDTQMAAQALGIKTSDEYKVKRQLDEALPARPELTFAKNWISWYDFLGKEAPEFYNSLEEAAQAAQHLQIINSRDYSKRYKQDPLLPANPYKVYKTSWKNWTHFLGKKGYYPTYLEASIAARKLGATTLAEYHILRKKDPRLPHNIYHLYRDEFTTISEFLGTTPIYYSTYEEAQKAILTLKIRTSNEYKSRYKEDPLLPYKPKLAYGDKWQGWKAYLGQLPKLETLPIWQTRVKAWVNLGRNIDMKLSTIKDFVENLSVPNMPELILSKEYNFNFKAYSNLVESLTESRQKHFHSYCTLFLDWVIENHCSEENEDGELVTLTGFKNPLKDKKLSHLKFSSAYRANYQTDKPVLPFAFIDKARNYLFPQSAESFTDISKTLTKIFSADWNDIPESQIDKLDPNCVYRKIDENRYQIWNPSRAVALFTLLMVPLRGQQILWLDSGEADDIIPYLSGNKIVFRENTNHLNKHKKHREGVVQSDNNELAMYITTNKTSANLGGYQINYLPDSLARWLIRLREWQSKYNPIDTPMSWQDINLPRRVNPFELKKRGSQCFLFRKSSTEVFLTNSTFPRHLAQVLYEIQGDQKLATFKNKIYQTPFTPHSMRVSLITAYVIDGGVPINIVSKLVGHASIVMTIYYTKVGHNKMRQELGKAEKKIMKEQANNLQQLVNNQQIETAKAHLFARDADYFESLDNSWPAASYQFSDKGICPKSGLACDSGGWDDSGQSSNEAVPNGYLGRRNCIRCKYFITGPAFIGGLQALTNEISLEINSAAKEYLKQENIIKNLEDEKYDCEIENQIFTLGKELTKAQCHFEQKAMKLDALICDFLSATKLVKTCIAMMRSPLNNSDQKLLIVGSEISEFTCELKESNEEISLVNNICEDAKIYSSASCSRALPIRSQILDKISANIGLKPFLFSLNDEEQLIIGNQYAQLLKERFKSWESIAELEKNTFTINCAEALEIEDLLKEMYLTKK